METLKRINELEVLLAICYAKLRNEVRQPNFKTEIENATMAALVEYGK